MCHLCTTSVMYLSAVGCTCVSSVCNLCDLPECWLVDLCVICMLLCDLSDYRQVNMLVVYVLPDWQQVDLCVTWLSASRRVCGLCATSVISLTVP